MKVRYTEAALGELDEIFAYIFERNRAAAAAVVDRFKQIHHIRKTLVIARRPKGNEAIQREFRTTRAAPAYAGVRCARNDGYLRARRTSESRH